jgi:hypothetical protein
MTTAPPDLDPELLVSMAAMPEASALGPETLDLIRSCAAFPPEVPLAGRTLDGREVTVTRAESAQIQVSVLTPAGGGLSAATAPCIYWILGGGMVMGWHERLLASVERA